MSFLARRPHRVLGSHDRRRSAHPGLCRARPGEPGPSASPCQLFQLDGRPATHNTLEDVR